MFGYVRIYSPELKVREYTLYRGVYCGLCRTMKKRTCRSSTLALSYDFTFLAFFRTAIADQPFELKKSRCGLHVFKKRSIAIESSGLRYCAGASAVLNYYKLLDDLTDKDKKGIKKLFVRLLLPHAKRHLKAAVRSFPEYRLDALSDKVKELLKALSLLEASLASPDACADAFGNVLASVFCHGINEPQLTEYVEKIGYHMGKWIYFADAVNDYYDDKKSGSFNPFIAAGYETMPCQLISNCMTLELGAVYNEMNKLSIQYSDIQNIICNTVTLGMPYRADTIFKKYAPDNCIPAEKRGE